MIWECFSLNIQPYPGDGEILSALAKKPERPVVSIFEPEGICAVLGAGGKPERELFLENLQRDQIPIYRRQGGGGAVILAPGMIVISVACYVKDRFRNHFLFEVIPSPPAQTLEEMTGLYPISPRGLSDLTWREYKILGSSLRRNSHLLLYQGVLLYSADRSLFSRYLPHPPKEPDYRGQRTHEQFTRCLSEIADNLPPLSEFLPRFEKRYSKRFFYAIKDHLVSSDFQGEGRTDVSPSEQK